MRYAGFWPRLAAILVDYGRAFLRHGVDLGFSLLTTALAIYALPARCMTTSPVRW